LAWTIEYDEAAVRDLKKLDHQVQREILDFMEKRIGRAEDPRSFGKPLRHSKFGLWRYRLRNYLIICQLHHSKLIVLVVAIGHRSTIYDD
jgi:mRNA interferase RelE/StbE